MWFTVAGRVPNRRTAQDKVGLSLYFLHNIHPVENLWCALLCTVKSYVGRARHQAYDRARQSLRGLRDVITREKNDAGEE